MPVVDLLTVVPTTVAVSSTVQNSRIRPEHLVDGDRTTAWNSRTGDLVGAWIAIRLPPDAAVTSIKLTVGFTNQDPKLGDLFTENPRIAKIRITHDKNVVEKQLDVDDRGLQEIAFGGGGGDYKIEILDVKLGTKQNWREICVSELEVWGTTPAPPPAKRVRPVVQLGSLDIDCAGTVTLLDRYAVCDTQRAGTETYEAIHSLQLVSLATRRKLGAAVELTTAREHPASMTTYVGPEGFTTTPLGNTFGRTELAVSVLALTAKELALYVDKAASQSGMADGFETHEVTIYRPGEQGLANIWSGAWTYSSGEETSGQTCQLRVGTPRKSLPDLVLECQEWSSNYHDDTRPKGEFRKPVTTKFRWDGAKYVER